MANEHHNVSDKHLVIVLKLRQIALQQMRKTGYSAQFHTLQKTEVANELFEDRAVIQRFDDLLSRADADTDPQALEEFIKLCTIKIKHNLIDHMRRKFAEKRGGKSQPVPLDDSLSLFIALEVKDDQIDHLNEALDNLEKESEMHAGIISDKYFLGLKNKEIAQKMNVSLSKVEKDLHYAIAWLRRELSR